VASTPAPATGDAGTAEATPGATGDASTAEATPGATGDASTAEATPPATADAATGTAAAGGAAHPSRPVRILRAVVATLLIILGVLSLVLAPLAIWGRNLILNTDRYVSTVSPLASDPAVQGAIITAVNKQVESNLDVSGLVGSVLPPKATSALAPALQSAVYGLVNDVTTRFVESDQFQKIWNTMNRTAHTQIVNILTGKKLANSTVYVKQGKVELDLGQVVDNVKARLVSSGLSVASKVPPVGATIEIAEVKGLTKAQSLVRALNTIADWILVVGLALVALGAVIARNHRKAVLRAAIGLGVGMIVIGLGLAIGRSIYLNNIPTSVLPRAAAGSIYDTLVRYFRWGIRIVFVIALLVVLGLWVSGPGKQAAAFRHWCAKAWRRGGEGAEAAAPFVARNANVFRVAIVLLGGLVLILASASITTFIVIAVIVALLLLAVEGLRRLAAREAQVEPVSP
jgi:hypothetical protein